MKPKIQNSLCLTIILLLMFTLIPSGVLAMEPSDTSQTIGTASIKPTDNLETQNNSMNVTYTSDFKNGFKVNSLTAKRTDNSIVFTVNYESTNDGAYSFFDPPNGNTIMKINESGIKAGANTAELSLTVDEFNSVLASDSISMLFNINNSISFINFKTAQLQSLSNTDFDGTVDFLTNYKDGFKVDTLTAKRSGDTVAFTVNYVSTHDCDYNFFNSPNADIIAKTVTGGIKQGTNTSVLELTLDEFKQVLSADTITMRFGLDENGSVIFFKTAQLQSLLTEDPGQVKVNPTAITLNKKTANLAVNGSEKLTASLSPSNATETTISWNSSDPTVATVDSNGNVKGLKAGTTNITATTVNNLSATCQVTVSSTNTEKSISYQTHVENDGWQDWKTNGDMSGTSARSLRLEGIKIKLNNYENLGVEYQTHIQNIGWESETNRGWKSNGDMSGTQGLSYRLEAIQIKLTGTDADKYDIYYQVHAQNLGWLDWAKNGESSGTAGLSYRLEGIRIKIVSKGDPAPGLTDRPFVVNNPYIDSSQIPQALTLLKGIKGTWKHTTPYGSFSIVNEITISDSGNTTGKISSLMYSTKGGGGDGYSADILTNNISNDGNTGWFTLKNINSGGGSPPKEELNIRRDPTNNKIIYINDLSYTFVK
ncbi:Ig-like domain-containing protein [Acetobacterium sp.]|uniref:Ig-like domain-containing protein n=1 Tax=Acetobacterium sp. TaxID=1872094 RepID=UPI0035940BEC